MRTHGVNQTIRFVEGKSRQIRFFFRKKTLFSSFVRVMNLLTLSSMNDFFGPKSMGGVQGPPPMDFGPEKSFMDERVNKYITASWN